MTESRQNTSSSVGVGVAFFALAVTMGLTMDNWAIAIPFAVLAVTFVLLGVQRPRGARPGDDEHRTP